MDGHCVVDGLAHVCDGGGQYYYYYYEVVGACCR